MLRAEKSSSISISSISSAHAWKLRVHHLSGWVSTSTYVFYWQRVSVFKVLTALCVYMQVRSAKLGSLPLTSLSLLHQQGQNAGGHPVILAGSYDNQACFCLVAVF